MLLNSNKDLKRGTKHHQKKSSNRYGLRLLKLIKGLSHTGSKEIDELCGW